MTVPLGEWMTDLLEALRLIRTVPPTEEVLLTLRLEASSIPIDLREDFAQILFLEICESLATGPISDRDIQRTVWRVSKQLRRELNKSRRTVTLSSSQIVESKPTDDAHGLQIADLCKLLNDQEVIVLNLRLENQTLAAIGRQLGTSTSQVHRILSHIREKLRRELSSS